MVVTTVPAWTTKALYLSNHGGRLGSRVDLFFYKVEPYDFNEALDCLQRAFNLRALPTTSRSDIPMAKAQTKGCKKPIIATGTATAL